MSEPRQMQVSFWQWVYIISIPLGSLALLYLALAKSADTAKSEATGKPCSERAQ